MSHEIELDYAEIQENLDLSDYITRHDVEDYVSEYAEDAFQMFKDEMRAEGDFDSELKAQLESFKSSNQPCSTGRLFIDAVEKVQHWNGESFDELPTSASQARTDLKHEVRIVLRDILSELVIGKADDATSND